MRNVWPIGTDAKESGVNISIVWERRGSQWDGFK